MQVTSKLYDPFVIETDYVGDPEFFQPYKDQMPWTTSKDLYGERITEITGGKWMDGHYIQHIDKYDMKLKRFVADIFKTFGVKTKDFRADFFLVKPGGVMHEHVDSESKVAFLLPLSPNTGPLVLRDGNARFMIAYQTLTILNTQVPHAVESPTEDRLLFRIGVHDVRFEELGVFKELKNRE